MSALPDRFYDLGGGVFRSAQPTTAEQWQTLVGEYRVRFVVQLCFHTEEHAELGVPPPAAVALYYEPMEPEGDEDLWDEAVGVFVQPDEEQMALVDRLLATATPEAAWLVHCIHGQDRTGFVAGRLRVNRDGWSKDRAMAEEMVARGYHRELIGLDVAWSKFKGGT